MPKRKRNLEEKSEEESSSSIISESRPKRRRNDTTLVDTIQFIFDALRNKKKDDDLYLCEGFLRVPRKKTEPQYYEVVKKPIDMLKIQQKIKTDIYNEIEEFYQDVELLVENAKLYYAKSTDEYKDACEMFEIFSVAKKDAPEEINRMRQSQEEEEVKTSRRRGRPPKTSLASSAPMIMEEDGSEMTVEDAIEELFGAIVTASDTEGRIHSYDFQLLPAPEKYPDYYQVIQQPIDLKTIALHIQSKQYENLESLERDMTLMFDNACAFNEPGSRIFKDARILKKLVQMRKQDLHHVLNAKKSVRLRSKRPPVDKKWSELVANLIEGEMLPLPEDEQIDMSISTTTHDDDDSDVDMVDQENPFWQLFIAAKSLAAPNDPNYLLVEPFRRLPNRRWHSDYYQEIKNPISLTQIKKKVLKCEYQCLADMLEDFDLMLDNAQQYNRPDSRIHRDAVKLQKFLHVKAEELKPNEEENQQDSESDSDDNESQMGSKRKGGQSKPWTFKRRAKLLFKTLMDYMTDDARQPIVAFIEKPSKKDYPDYYEIINEPMDMEMIETKIKTDRYNNDDELISDFRLMFSNCQTYNEEGSQIFKDANILHKVLNDKLREIQCNSNETTPSRPRMPKRSKLSLVMTVTKNIKLLYNAIKDYRDRDNRLLSEVFNKLPPKSLYPDYYEVIKHPIDLDRILNKWKEGDYSSLDDLLSDVTLMFQNACRYNEPESQIYRDALTLQRLSLQKRLELTSREETVPNVGGLVQELLMSLFISVFNLEEPDGRYTAESFSDLPDYEEVDGQKTRMISFDIMKRRLDKGLYSRLDRFQSDLFAVFDRARKAATCKESRLFQDSVTLQKEYMKVRDELCSYGSILESQALEFKEKDLEELLEQVLEKFREEEEQNIKKEEDIPDSMMEDEDSKASVTSSDGASNSASVRHNEVQYHVGDFVFVKNSDQSAEYPILHIQRLWTNNEGEQMLYGCQYYRPVETFHIPTKKFYEQEVFKTDKHLGVPLTDIIRKCVVMSTIDYVKLQAEGVDAKDIFICESRYSTKHRVFKKIKVWPFNLPQDISMIERDEPIEINRVGSVYKDRVNKHKEELVDVDEETKMIWDRPPNVVQPSEASEKGNTFYQQYNISSGPIKLGDFVYVRSSGIKSVRHITRIWVSPEGNGFFTGSRYVMVADVTATGNRSPYRNEVYLTSIQDTLPLSDIIGRCCVLYVKEYVALRHTEIPEKDVFVVENFFEENNQRLCALQSGISKFNNLLPEVMRNEIYHFYRTIDISKFEIVQSAISKRMKSELMQNNGDIDNEDSLDGPPASVASADSSAPSTPKPVKKKSSTGKKVLSGYILFSGEIRKSVTQKNPEANFGEISRLVGNEWKRLTESERKAFEDRAHLVNIENAEKAALMNNGDPGTPQSTKITLDLPLPKNRDVVFECLWDNCDFMFEDIHDLYEHLLGEPNGHVFKVKTVFECSWRGCPRQKKSSLAPFQMLQRLARHMREVHILKNNGIYMEHGNRSRNFIASTRKSLLADTNSAANIVSSVTSTTQGLSAGRENQYQITFGAPIQVNGNVNSTQVNGVAPQKPMDPLFVNPPPKTQRLLHSEAYIKYIENLDKQFVSNWERQLSATVDNTLINESGRLPAQWLSNGTGNHGSVVSALWALREYMMKDSLGIAKIL